MPARRRSKNIFLTIPLPPAYGPDWRYFTGSLTCVPPSVKLPASMARWKRSPNLSPKKLDVST